MEKLERHVIGGMMRLVERDPRSVGSRGVGLLRGE